ncbi:MAG: hypothetical protein PHW60_05655 [Kiritimatiellae bacterium]|nr:hypothetical protein [Kiritimatiellia bacterium]
MTNIEDTTNLCASFTDMLTACKACLECKLFIPGLALAYTTIDAAAWVAYGDQEKEVGLRFRKWIDEWILQKHSLGCTSQELYAARCGVLHRLNPDSTLTVNKGTRLVVYAWGSAAPEPLNKVFTALGHHEMVTLHADKFVLSLEDGITSFINDAKGNKSRLERLKQCNTRSFSNVKSHVVSNLENAIQEVEKKGLQLRWKAKV